ncbi:MAG: CotH kinase family protein [Lachnospiraceae bacterium]|nr:CotH kinase family protein [Lachnospiraceae bacterium]
MKKRILAMLLAASVAILGVGCETANNNKDNSESKAPDAEYLSEEEQLFNKMFDINTYVKIEIDISNEELMKIEEDYNVYRNLNSKSPIYRKADKVTFTIGDEKYEIEEVGIRMKGNTSRTSFYSEEEGMHDLVHFKLSFDETFDDPKYYGTDAKVWENETDKLEREKRKFATMTSIELKWNKNFDTTYVREIYANDMFRDFGLMSQHCNASNFILSGTNMGVWTIYEAVDKQFLKKYYGNNAEIGDLYKAAWSASYGSWPHYGIDDEDAGKSYVYDLKTNKTTSDHSLFKNFIDVVNDRSATKETYETVLEAEDWVMFNAVSYFAGNPDDFRNNYNNHYVYLQPDGKARFITYDNDRVFGITVDWNPEGTGMTAVSPFSELADGLGRFQENPIIRKTILDEDGFYYKEYKEALAEVASSKWLTNEHFTKYYEAVKNNYESCVQPDNSYKNAEKTDFKFTMEGEYDAGPNINMSFEEYVTRKMITYNEAIEE